MGCSRKAYYDDLRESDESREVVKPKTANVTSLIHGEPYEICISTKSSSLSGIYNNQNDQFVTIFDNFPANKVEVIRKLS